MSNSALASLTAQYTDSENDDSLESPDSQNSQVSQVIIPPPRHTPQHQTPEKSQSKTKNEDSDVIKNNKKRIKKMVKRLVSYQDDTIVSDEGDVEEEDEEYDEVEKKSMSPAFNEHEGECRPEIKLKPLTQIESTMGMEEMLIEHVQKDNVNNKIDKYVKYAHYGFALPPAPKGKPLPELTEKIKQLYEKMGTSNMEMNRVIQQRKEFRNPSIYEKLIQFCDINEFGTNYPPEMYDPLQWGPESFYEELARVQKNEMVKRQKEKKDTDKIEQVSALARKVEEEAKKRKSKWDQPASSAKPVIAPTLTTTVTGTKGTVISAFGSLPKKPSA